MGFDQRGALVFHVVRDKTGAWDVKEEGFDQPLASFDTSDEAREYALDIAKSKEGSTVKIYDEKGNQILNEHEIEA